MRAYSKGLDLASGDAANFGSMMRLIATLLLLTTFASNATWAFDVHLDNESSGTVTLINVGDNGAGSGHEVATCADHCHHGASHLLGLQLHQNSEHAPQPQCMTCVHPDSLITHFPSLPIEPPRT